MRVSIYNTISVANTLVQVPVESDISAWLEPYGVRLTNAQIEQIQVYIAMLVFWNQKISLTSIESLQEIVCRHFGESFYFARFIAPGEGRLADIGSGAGFPGLALKTILNNIQVFLIEQDTRKSTFLNEVVRRLELASVKVLRSTYEALPPEQGNFDWIVARAVGNHKHLLKWARSRLNPPGQVALWLGSEDATRISQINGWHWLPPHIIPNSKRRVILMGTPVI